MDEGRHLPRQDETSCRTASRRASSYQMSDLIGVRRRSRSDSVSSAAGKKKGESGKTRKKYVEETKEKKKVGKKISDKKTEFRFPSGKKVPYSPPEGGSHRVVTIQDTDDQRKNNEKYNNHNNNAEKEWKMEKRKWSTSKLSSSMKSCNSSSEILPPQPLPRISSHLFSPLTGISENFSSCTASPSKEEEEENERRRGLSYNNNMRNNNNKGSRWEGKPTLTNDEISLFPPINASSYGVQMPFISSPLLTEAERFSSAPPLRFLGGGGAGRRASSTPKPTSSRASATSPLPLPSLHAIQFPGVNGKHVATRTILSPLVAMLLVAMALFLVAIPPLYFSPPSFPPDATFSIENACSATRSVHSMGTNAPGETITGVTRTEVDAQASQLLHRQLVYICIFTAVISVVSGLMKYFVDARCFVMLSQHLKKGNESIAKQQSIIEKKIQAEVALFSTWWSLVEEKFGKVGVDGDKAGGAEEGGRRSRRSNDNERTVSTARPLWEEEDGDRRREGGRGVILPPLSAPSCTAVRSRDASPCTPLLSSVASTPHTMEEDTTVLLLEDGTEKEEEEKERMEQRKNPRYYNLECRKAGGRGVVCPVGLAPDAVASPFGGDQPQKCSLSPICSSSAVQSSSAKVTLPPPSLPFSLRASAPLLPSPFLPPPPSMPPFFVMSTPEPLPFPCPPLVALPPPHLGYSPGTSHASFPLTSPSRALEKRSDTGEQNSKTSDGSSERVSKGIGKGLGSFIRRKGSLSSFYPSNRERVKGLLSHIPRIPSFDRRQHSPSPPSSPLSCEGKGAVGRKLSLARDPLTAAGGCPVMDGGDTVVVMVKDRADDREPYHEALMEQEERERERSGVGAGNRSDPFFKLMHHPSREDPEGTEESQKKLHPPPAPQDSHKANTFSSTAHPIVPSALFRAANSAISTPSPPLPCQRSTRLPPYHYHHAFSDSSGSLRVERQKPSLYELLQRELTTMQETIEVLFGDLYASSNNAIRSVVPLLGILVERVHHMDVLLLQWALLVDHHEQFEYFYHFWASTMIKDKRISGSGGFGGGPGGAFSPQWPGRRLSTPQKGGLEGSGRNGDSGGGAGRGGGGGAGGGEPSKVYGNRRFSVSHLSPLGATDQPSVESTRMISGNHHFFSLRVEETSKTAKTKEVNPSVKEGSTTVEVSNIKQHTRTEEGGKLQHVKDNQWKDKTDTLSGPSCRHSHYHHVNSSAYRSGNSNDQGIKAVSRTFARHVTDLFRSSQKSKERSSRGFLADDALPTPRERQGNEVVKGLQNPWSSTPQDTKRSSREEKNKHQNNSNKKKKKKRDSEKKVNKKKKRTSDARKERKSVSSSAREAPLQRGRIEENGAVKKNRKKKVDFHGSPPSLSPTSLPVGPTALSFPLFSSSLASPPFSSPSCSSSSSSTTSLVSPPNISSSRSPHGFKNGAFSFRRLLRLRRKQMTSILPHPSWSLFSSSLIPIHSKMTETGAGDRTSMRTNNSNSNHYHHHRHEMERVGEEGSYSNKLHFLISPSSSFSSSFFSSLISHPSLSLHRGHRFPTDNKNVFFFITLNRVEFVKERGKFSLPLSESVKVSNMERKREKNGKEESNQMLPNNTNNSNNSTLKPVFYHLAPHGEWEGTLVSSSIIIFEASTTTVTMPKTNTGIHEQHDSTFTSPFSSSTFPANALSTSFPSFSTLPPPMSTGGSWKAEGIEGNSSVSLTSRNSSRSRRTSSTLIDRRKEGGDVDRKEGMKENRRGGAKVKVEDSFRTKIIEVSSFDFSHEEDLSGKDVPSPNTVNGDCTDENSSVCCLGHNRRGTAAYHPESSDVPYEFQNGQYPSDSSTHHHHRRYSSSNTYSRTGSRTMNERGENDADGTAVFPPNPAPNRDNNNNSNNSCCCNDQSSISKSASASRRDAFPFSVGLSSFSSHRILRFPGRKNKKKGEDGATTTHSDDDFVSSRNLHSSSSSSSTSDAGDHNNIAGAAGVALNSFPTSFSSKTREGRRRERHEVDQKNEYAAQPLLSVRYEGERGEEHSVTSERSTTCANEKKRVAVAGIVTPNKRVKRKDTRKKARGMNLTVQQVSYQIPLLPSFELSPVPFTSRYLESFSSSSSSSCSSCSSSFRSSGGITSSKGFSPPPAEQLMPRPSFFPSLSSEPPSRPPHAPLKERENPRLPSTTISCTPVLEYVTKGVPYTMHVLDQKGENNRRTSSNGRAAAAAAGGGGGGTGAGRPNRPGMNEQEEKNGVPLPALPPSFSSFPADRAHHLQQQQEENGVREDKAHQYPYGHYPTPMPSKEGSTWEEHRRPPSSTEWDLLHFLCLGKEKIRQKRAYRGHPIGESPARTTVVSPASSSSLSSPISFPSPNGRKIKKEDTAGGGGAAAAITTSYLDSHLPPPPLPLPLSSTFLSILTSGSTKKRGSSLFSQNNGGRLTPPRDARALEPRSLDHPMMRGIHQKKKKIDKKEIEKTKKRGREKRSPSLKEMRNNNHTSSNTNATTPYDLSHDPLLSVTSTQPPLTPFQPSSNGIANLRTISYLSSSSFTTSSGCLPALPESFLMSWSCLTPRPMRLTFLAVHLASPPSSAAVSSSSFRWLPPASAEPQERRNSPDHERNSTTRSSPPMKSGENALTLAHKKNTNKEEKNHYVGSTTLDSCHQEAINNAPSSPPLFGQESVMAPVLECMIDEVLCVLTHAVVTMDHHTNEIFCISLEGNSIECVNPIKLGQGNVGEKQKGNREHDLQSEFMQQPQCQQQKELTREVKEQRNEGMMKRNISPSSHTFPTKKGDPEKYLVTNAGPGGTSEKGILSKEKNVFKEFHGDGSDRDEEWGGGENRGPQWGRGRNQPTALENREEIEFHRRHRNFEVMIGDFRREVIYV